MSWGGWLATYVSDQGNTDETESKRISAIKVNWNGNNLVWTTFQYLNIKI